MEKLSEIEYIISYDELIEQINQGYYVAGHLKIALEKNLIKNDGKRIRVYMDCKGKKIDIFGTVICKHKFGKLRYYFTDRAEVFPDEDYPPKCFGNIIQNNGESSYELDFCRRCKYYTGCCDNCEIIQKGIVTIEQIEELINQ